MIRFEKWTSRYEWRYDWKPERRSIWPDLGDPFPPDVATPLISRLVKRSYWSIRQFKAKVSNSSLTLSTNNQQNSLHHWVQSGKRVGLVVLARFKGNLNHFSSASFLASVPALSKGEHPVTLATRISEIHCYRGPLQRSVRSNNSVLAILSSPPIISASSTNATLSFLNQTLFSRAIGPASGRNQKANHEQLNSMANASSTRTHSVNVITSQSIVYHKHLSRQRQSHSLPCGRHRQLQT